MSFRFIFGTKSFFVQTPRVNICPTGELFRSPTSVLVTLPGAMVRDRRSIEDFLKPLLPGGPQVFLFQCCFSMTGGGLVQVVVFFCVCSGCLEVPFLCLSL